MRDLNKSKLPNNPNAAKRRREDADEGKDGENADGDQKGDDQKGDGKLGQQIGGKKSDGKKSDGKLGDEVGRIASRKVAPMKNRTMPATRNLTANRTVNREKVQFCKKGADGKKADGKSAEGKKSDGKSDGEADGEKSDGKIAWQS